MGSRGHWPPAAALARSRQLIHFNQNEAENHFVLTCISCEPTFGSGEKSSKTRELSRRIAYVTWLMNFELGWLLFYLTRRASPSLGAQSLASMRSQLNFTPVPAREPGSRHEREISQFYPPLAARS